MEKRERERLTLLDGTELFFEVDIEVGSGHVFLRSGERSKNKRKKRTRVAS